MKLHPTIVGNQHMVHALTSREYGQRNAHRKNLRLLRTLMTGGNYEYRKVWQQSAKSQVVESGITQIFFDNYKTSYSGYSAATMSPVCKYRTSRQQIPYKIVNVNLYQTSPTCVGRPTRRVYAVTRGQFLGINANSGEVEFEIPVSCAMNSVKLYDDRDDMLCLASKMKPATPAARGRGERREPDNVLMTIAIVRVAPLQLIYMFHITRDVFGSNVKNVSLNNTGILMVENKDNIARAYDFNTVLKHNEIVTQPVDLPNFGAAPLDVNIAIKRLSPCLFEMRSHRNYFQCGGLPPYYCLKHPVGNEFSAHVSTLVPGTLLRNGILHSSETCLEPDRFWLHDDNSNRLVQMGPADVKMWRIEESDEGAALELEFTITPHVIRQLPEGPVVTASGRRVKQRQSSDEINNCFFDMTIHSVDHDDDLDLLVVTFTYMDDGDPHSKVSLYDNVTGRFLSSISLQAPPAEHCSQQVVLDEDTVVHTMRPKQGLPQCLVYRLFERGTAEAAGTKPGSPSRRRSQRSNRTGNSRTRSRRR